MSLKNVLGTPRYQKVNRDSRIERWPIFLFLFLFTAASAFAGGSIYIIFKKDNEIEKFRRVELELQNQIKERDMLIHQKRQHIEQLERRVEIIDAIKELSYNDLPEQDVRKIAFQIEEMGKKFGHDPLMLTAIIYNESSFRPQIDSVAGAHGLMQLMPSTGKALTKQVVSKPKMLGYYEKEEMAEIPRYNDIEGNIQLGTLYLTQLMMRYKNLEEAIYAYNLGPNLYEKRKVEGGQLPVKYRQKILATYQKLLSKRDEKTMPLPSIQDATGPQNLLAQASFSKN